jgi:hypothetical protein
MDENDCLNDCPKCNKRTIQITKQNEVDDILLDAFSCISCSKPACIVSYDGQIDESSHCRGNGDTCVARYCQTCFDQQSIKFGSRARLNECTVCCESSRKHVQLKVERKKRKLRDILEKYGVDPMKRLFNDLCEHLIEEI